MKILMLSLENINALKGRWHIDFGSKAFQNEGIFSITGQTGAGKTTILDAICLALYGETPRLGKITKSDNALMHLGAGECSAEVVIEIQEERYRFYFGQRRAKKHPTGALQDPKREIVRLHNDKDDELLAEKLREVDALAIQLLGMDFNQFTRSVMLAQGAFSAFLRSGAHERGEILEKITGTQIYAKLGALAYTTYKDKHTELKALKERLAQLPLLSADELDSIDQALTHYQQKKHTLSQRHDALEQQLRAKLTHQRHLDAINDYEQALHIAEQQLANTQADAKRLAVAKIAQRLQPTFASLTSLRNNHHLEKQALDELQASLPALDNAYQHAKKISQDAKAAFMQAQTDYDVLKELLKQVRALDAQIIEQQSIKEAHKQRLEDITQQYQQTLKAQDSLTTKLQQLQNKQHTLNTQLASIQHFAQLDVASCVHMLTIWLEHCATSYHLSDTLQTLQGSIEKERTHVATQHTAWQAFQNELTTLTKQIEAEQHNLALMCQLKNYEAYAVNEFIQKCTQDSTSLITTLKDAQSLEQQQQLLTEQEHAYHSLQDDLAYSQQILIQQQADIAHHEQALTYAKQRLADQQAHLDTLKALGNLQTYFEALTEGVPCPLCGSTSHPYKHSQAHLSSQDAAQLQKDIAHLQQDITTKTQALDNAKLSHQTTLSTHAHQQQQLAELQKTQHATKQHYQQHWQAIYQVITTHAPTLMVSATPPDSKDAITQLIAQLNTSYSNLQALHQALTLAQQTLGALQNAYQQKEHECHMASLTHEHHKQALQAQTQQWKHTHQQLQALAPSFKKLSDDLAHLFAWHTLSPSNHTSFMRALECANSLPTLLKTLTKETLPQLYQNTFHLKTSLLTPVSDELRHALDAGSKEYQHIQQALNHTAIDITHVHTQKQDHQTAITAQKHTLDTLTQEHQVITMTLQALHTQRQALFANKNADDADAAASLAITKSQAQWQATEEIAKDAYQHYLQAQERTKTHHHHLQQLEASQQAQEARFAQELTQAGFDTTEQWQAACLNDDEISTLEQSQAQYRHDIALAKDKLKIEQQALKTLLTSIKKTLNMEAEQFINLEQEALIAQKEAQAAQLSHISEHIGQLRQRHEYAHTLQQQAHELTQTISLAETDALVWARLNTLIGSADGKKYRNFVQSLTLEMVLMMANDVLKKMTDRYALIVSTDEKNPLGIDVMDFYQGGKIRSSKNLSGGESFVVSLALALGLANIHSQKMHIESLFLDEGFGTLDEEALDIALSALSEIQATGKSIGIISHVSALKERIHTQIIVEKKSGGISIIKGAGVSTS